MDLKTNISIGELLKKMKIQDFIYPAVILVFLITTIILFISATSSISKNINKIFTQENTGRAQGLNLDQYKLVAKKLNIIMVAPTPVIRPQTAATSTPQVRPEAATKSAPQPTTIIRVI